MRSRHIGMKRRVNRGCARVEVEGAVRQDTHHFVLEIDAAIESFQGLQLFHVKGSEPVELDRTYVAAGALDPKHFDGLSRQRVLLQNLCRSVAPAIVGDAFVGAEQIGTIKQPLWLAHTGRLGVVPKVGQTRGGARFEHD